MRSLLLVIFTTAALFAKAQSITTRDKGATLTYAKQELQEFLKKCPAAKDLDITLKTDTTLAEASFSTYRTQNLTPDRERKTCHHTRRKAPRHQTTYQFPDGHLVLPHRRSKRIYPQPGQTAI